MKTKRVIFNVFYSIVSQAIAIACGLIIPRIIMVGYGSEINGLLNSVTQFIAYLALFEAGIQVLATQKLYKAVNFNDKKEINDILSAVNKNYKTTGCIYFAVLMVLALCYPALVRDSGIPYYVAFFVIVFSGLGNVISFFFQGKYKILLQAEGKNYIITNLQTIVALLNNFAKIILLLLGYDVVLVIGTTFLISLLQVYYIQRYIKKRYPWIIISKNPSNIILKQKGVMLIHQFAGMIFMNTDVLLLTFFCDLRVVSVYSIYKMIMTHISNILNSIFKGGVFALGQLYNSNKKQYTRVIDVVEVYFSAIVFAIYTVVLYLIDPFIKLYTQGVSDIVYADSLLGIMFVIVEVLTFMRTPMLNTINFAEKFKETLPQTLIETGINLTVSIGCVKYMGIYGVLFGTIVALVYRTLDIIIYSNRKLLERSPFKTFKIYALVFLISQVLLKVFSLLQIREINSYKDFVIVGMMLTPISIGMFLSLASIFFKKEFCFFKDFIFKKMKSHW